LIHSIELSALIVTHDQTEAMAIADHITLLRAGSIEQEGTPTELYKEPKTLFAAEFMGTNNRLSGTMVEQSGARVLLDVMGVRMQGLARQPLRIGEDATAVVRIERMLLGGGPGPNRIPMKLSAQMFLGERWELVFVKDVATARVHALAPLKHEHYHVEFPAEALWIFQPPS
jgi:iron(III) transport system ATP-binding protein